MGCELLRIRTSSFVAIRSPFVISYHQFFHVMNNILPENILLADKPKGITSFDVIRILRKKMGIRKMGHAGTLDPLASGLMIIGINDGTKKMTDFLKLPKTYIADILLGKKTETGDAEGKIKVEN